ncbi:hypothetical protein WOLCODRAFT_137289 [Wolfiporia cocos MD-104 SS10]|uniref:Uncharacterized protein n=1 Tax=Wolfiporia cocos (strain MD-104) TaxID=742152 RepID=A0A2H3JGH4_WOLCO|nr:hypothetical protein WOLCODRAFT_137289 [Wolfiporia cocos MD-104 SS10]
MCYVHGSIDQATSSCPMCKVFKPVSAVRCPHIKEICRNRAQHPRHDVVYLKNAEVQTFIGCGFCKWAATNPTEMQSGYQNPGWPGCCRPPRQDEVKLIGAADWYAVSIVHHIPIPSDIKALLESVTSSKNGGSPIGSLRISSQQAPSMSRRVSYQVTGTPRVESASTRTQTMPIPSRGRSGGSPQQANAPLTSRNGHGNSDGIISSLPNRSAVDQYPGQRRSNADHRDHSEKRSESTGASQHSPGHRNADLGGSLSRRSMDSRPSLSSILPSVNKVAPDAQPQRRRSQTTTRYSPPLSAPTRNQISSRYSPPLANPTPRTAERQSIPPSVSQRRDSTLEKSFESMSISSASSSSSGSNSETTVISDGGFTDYLSDESEAELQRQAEAKAAILAQNQLEEQEFKAARQQLASVDLRPPKSWNSNNNGSNNGTLRSRSHTSAYSPASASTYGTPYPTGNASVAGSVQRV